MAHDEIAFIRQMQAKGLRVTPQRLLILDAVCEGKGHTTLAEILLRVKEHDATIDPSTVYRTLDLLCELGFVAANATANDGTVYEIVGQTPHHHLHCTVCGREVEIQHAAVEPLFEAMQRDYGFTVTTKHLMLDGVCGECRGKDN